MKAAPKSSKIVSYLLLGLLFNVTQVFAQQVLPKPTDQFKGHISLDAKNSTMDFPKQVTAPKGAPNVLLVMLDDVGFGAASTFGGPVNTPTLERLAKAGLIYNQFHTTAMCSPTRASLLTGRNHHSVHTGQIMELSTGYPGYNSMIGPETATIGEVLKDNGYNTAWVGKDHNVPDWEGSPVGPFDRWPTGQGFEYFYGFIGGDMNQWRPAVFEGTTPVEPYVGKPDYNLDYDLADKAIQYIETQKSIAPDKPFFLYYAPGATHAPHHPRKEWIAKYKGKFDQGWDKVREETFARQKKLGIIPADAKLTERPKEIQAWESLNADQKALYAYMMEVYAGYLEQTDYNVGRVLDAVKASGQSDNTLVIYIVGDNGASGEGSPEGATNLEAEMNGIYTPYKEMLAHKDEIGTWKSYNHYPVGWAHAMDAPMQWCKQIASHYGGTRNGMVISWPNGIKDIGTIRSQWHHVIDIYPTILEATHIQAPYIVKGTTQTPIEGTSMSYTFDNPKAPSTHRTQYFELFGNRAIYDDGWIACTTPVGLPWVSEAPNVDIITGYKWELYHVAVDFTEANNLADQMPDKLKSMQLLFYSEAAKYNVLPLDDSRTSRLNPAIRPSLTLGRSTFTYYQGMKRLPEGVAPDIKNKSWNIKAYVDIPQDGTEGIITTMGGLFDGWALYIQKGKPVFHYNYGNVIHTSIAGTQDLTTGKHIILFDFKYDGGGLGKGGLGTLFVDGKQVAQQRIEKTVFNRFTLDETFDVGEDTGTPVNLDYDVPFKFNGKIDKIVITLEPGKLSPTDQNKLDEAKKKTEMKD